MAMTVIANQRLSPIPSRQTIVMLPLLMMFAIFFIIMETSSVSCISKGEQGETSQVQVDALNRSHFQLQAMNARLESAFEKQKASWQKTLTEKNELATKLEASLAQQKMQKTALKRTETEMNQLASKLKDAQGKKRALEEKTADEKDDVVSELEGSLKQLAAALNRTETEKIELASKLKAALEEKNAILKGAASKKDAVSSDSTTTLDKQTSALKKSETEKNEAASKLKGALEHQHNAERLSHNRTTLIIKEPKDDPEQSFAACLMLMDDNHHLIEWLAYHYHVLPLRRLIVNPDSKSKTSPISILNRWDGRINITVWNEEDLYPNGPPTGADSFTQYLRRQKQFIAKCALTLKTEGWGWTLFTDVDEYTLINPRAREKKDPMYTFGQEKLTVPSQAEAGSVLSLLQRGFPANATESKYLHGKSCVAITRKNFGTKETSDPQNVTKQKAWNASHFQTLRWRFHAGENDRPLGKAMIDLSRVNETSITRWDGTHAHRPIKDVCSKEGAWGSDKENAFLLYHYSATLEQMLFRSTDNRNTEGNGTAYRIERYNFEKQNFNHQMAPVVIQHWFDAFVETIGVDEAQRLLEHVGKPYEAANLVPPTLV